MKLKIALIMLLASSTPALSAQPSISLFGGLGSGLVILYDLFKTYKNFTQINDKKESTPQSEKNERIKKEVKTPETEIKKEKRKESSFFSFYFKRLFSGKQPLSLIGTAGLFGSILSHIFGITDFSIPHINSTQKFTSDLALQYRPKELPTKEEIDEHKKNKDGHYLRTEEQIQSTINKVSQGIADGRTSLETLKCELHKENELLKKEISFSKTDTTSQVLSQEGDLDCVVRSLFNIAKSIKKNVNYQVAEEYSKFKKIVLEKIKVGIDNSIITPKNNNTKTNWLQGKWLNIPVILYLFDQPEILNAMNITQEERKRIIIMTSNAEYSDTPILSTDKSKSGVESAIPLFTDSIVNGTQILFLDEASAHCTSFHVTQNPDGLFVFEGRDSLSQNPPFEALYKILEDPKNNKRYGKIEVLKAVIDRYARK